MQRSSVSLSQATFTWPDGTPLIRDLSAAFSHGRTGLIGANGSGKTTLLRLIAGELALSSGSLSASGAVGYLRQSLPLATDATVADLLGIAPVLAALDAIAAGSTAAADYEAIGDDWDIEARSHALLDAVGLGGLEFTRPVGRMSGGETILVALTGLRLADTPIVLLDEPTNNLDRRSRARLYESIAGWQRTLIVVSHDLALLELMDHTAELRGGGLVTFGGPYSSYRTWVEQEQAAAEQALRTAEQTLRTERRQRHEAQTKLARRRRYAKNDFENKRRPKIVMKGREMQAQVSAGKLRGELDEKVEAASAVVAASAERVRRDERIRIDLPDPQVPSRRRLASLSGFELVGPSRIALTGPNGIGKTRLLESSEWCERTGYLPQRLDRLDPSQRVIDVVADRARLARFLFDADACERRIGDLSGGERFRVALARLLLAGPPNQLLVLDEPTNNLDLASVDVLVDALDAYRGGLLVVSHDDAFLARLGITTWLELTSRGLSACPAAPEARSDAWKCSRSPALSTRSRMPA